MPTSICSSQDRDPLPGRVKSSTCLCIPFSNLLPSPLPPPPISSLPLSLSIRSSLFPSAKCVKVPFIPASWSGSIVLFKKVVWWCAGVPPRCAATAERPGRLQSVSQDSSSSKARGKTIHATTHQSLVFNHLSTLGRPSPVV